ncbi:MAG: LETM1-related biofilm-associated protein [Crocinitomicaceae bacterium]|nr:LETM1-related biofilm-associated protein [Crocinitomicaceae bacterium]
MLNLDGWQDLPSVMVLDKTMISPGAKGWINKYFDLVEKGQIELVVNRPEGLRKLHFMHLTLSHSGIVFGFPNEMIFGKSVETTDWTHEEKLKFLLFESHLFVFIQIHKDQVFNKEEFLTTLFDFYELHSASAIKKVFKFFVKESREEKIESILSKRVDIKVKILENKWWVNSLSNAFTYLDVILFDDFVHKEKDTALKSYSNYAMNALTAITLSSYSDGVLEDKEIAMFNIFLASANLGDEDRDQAKEKFKNGAELDDFSFFVNDHWLLKRFILDVAILTILSSEDIDDDEMNFLQSLCEHLEIPIHELEENLGLIENFLLDTKEEVVFMKDAPSYEKMYSSLSKRWVKILMRNKDKLAVELKQSKELVSLVKKSRKEELTKEEKEMVKTQFKDIAKSIPTLTIFMLPGGAILLPILLKIMPDLIPSAFKENEIEDQDV